MKNTILIIVLSTCYLFTQAQAVRNIGIGVDNPDRAKLEVWGVSGNGRTAAIIGDDKSVSILRGNPGIGLNMYSDNNGTFRTLSSGYSALWNVNPVLINTILEFRIAPSFASNAIITSSTIVWNFTDDGRLRIANDGFNGEARLDVWRGTGNDGTAMFRGTEFNSHINVLGPEHTHIRAGRAGSNVILNDIPNGKVIIGNGSTTVGINTNGYVPPTTLEVRQSQGGIELTNKIYPNFMWEWRVGSGSSPHYYLYYRNSARSYFSNVDGSYHSISDARLKTDIESLEPVMDKLLKLEGFNYKMKWSESSARQFGFMAQDVQLLFPSLVHESASDEGTILTMNYSALGVIAIKGVQEEQVQMEKIEKELTDIEKRLRVIEEKLKTKSK